jgi:hypothetical protein
MNRETLHLPPMPLKNFRHIGDLTPEKSAWWKEFGRALEAAHREWEGKKHQ